jgi:hypothetical protein
MRAIERSVTMDASCALARIDGCGARAARGDQRRRVRARSNSQDAGTDNDLQA